MFLRKIVSSSESARVKTGVPQGTVLGPLLFSTYINDLPSTVSSQVRLFADDCLLYRPIKCRVDQEKLQRDLSALQDWADRWGMCFNPSKCSVLRVSRPKSKNLEFQYTLKGETLENVSSTPYLGVCLSETLEWEAHIDKITSKASSTLGFLRRNLKACPHNGGLLEYLLKVKVKVKVAARGDWGTLRHGAPFDRPV